MLRLLVIIAALFTFPTTTMATTCTDFTCCRCSCCMGNVCSPAILSIVPVSSCIECNNVTCTFWYPTLCPSLPSGANGTNDVLCGPGGGAIAGWSGSYQVTSQCNTASCCCITGPFVATEIGFRQVTALVQLTGSCGGATSASLVINLSAPNATTGVATFAGQTFNFAQNGLNVSITSATASSCPATMATCLSGDCAAVVASTCFHQETIVNYEGKDYSLADFKNGLVPQCHVPHVVRVSNGVRITASCPLVQSSPDMQSSAATTTMTTTTGKEESKELVLRLTNDHLVYVSRGLLPDVMTELRAASTVRAGDIVYQDLAQTSPCQVTQVTQETGDQAYFGLNCEESNVLANGIKTSTFGLYHTIPALWMKYASRWLGIERASRFGDAVVNLLSKMNFL